MHVTTYNLGMFLSPALRALRARTQILDTLQAARRRIDICLHSSTSIALGFAPLTMVNRCMHMGDG